MKRVLIAAAPESGQAAAKALETHFELAFCTSLVDAESMLNDTFDLVLCGLHFDEGRMFDFLRYAKENPDTRAIPFFCIKSTEGVLTSTIFQSIEIASKALGADGFVELSQWRKDLGDELAYEKLRQLVDGVA